MMSWHVNLPSGPGPFVGNMVIRMRRYLSIYGPASAGTCAKTDQKKIAPPLPFLHSSDRSLIRKTSLDNRPQAAKEDDFLKSHIVICASGGFLIGTHAHVLLEVCRGVMENRSHMLRECMQFSIYYT